MRVTGTCATTWWRIVIPGGYTAPRPNRTREDRAGAVLRLESRVLLADLLLATRRLTEAQAAYAELARANPQSPLPESGLGALAYGPRTMTALGHYAKALELGADDARTHLEYAELLERKEADPPRPSGSTLRKLSN